MEPRRPLGDRPAGADELGKSLVVEAAHDRRAELAAEVLGPIVVEQDRHDVVDRPDRLSVEVDEVDGVSQPRPDLDRLRLGAAGRGEFGRSDAVAPRRADPGEQPELQPEVGGPGAIEPAQAAGQLVEPVVDRHPADCRMHDAIQRTR